MPDDFHSKTKAFEYLSIIRDAELCKPENESDEDLLNVSVELLLDLQNKNADLTSKQTDRLINSIPFTEAPKNKAKHIRKFKFLLIAAIISIFITILTLSTTADTKWSYVKKFKEMFGGVDKAPIGEVYYDGDLEFGKIEGIHFDTIDEFSKQYNIKVLVPGNKFTRHKLNSITHFYYNTHDEIVFTFDDTRVNYSIQEGNLIETDEFISNYPKTCINGFECYLLDLSDVSSYQLYFYYNGYTYSFVGYDLEVITELINCLEEIQ